MDFNTMKNMVNEIHKENKTPKVMTAIDMIWCAFRYGTGYLEYRLFGWSYVKGKKRKDFMVMRSSLEIYNQLNQREFLDIFEDKLKFLERFSDYIGRDFLDLSRVTFDEFADFCSKHKCIIVKPKGLSGGNGIKKIETCEYKDPHKLKKLFNQLIEDRLFVIEECLLQHKEMSELADSSINTLRMVTVVDKNRKVHLMYTILRIGDGRQVVDNASNGGVYTLVDNDGFVSGSAFRQKDGTLHDIHPTTNVVIKGRKIPEFDKCIELVQKAALEVPEIRYVGWDVAITPNGPVLIEGNTFPGYDMPQNYYYKCDGNNGILKRFLEVL